MRALSMVLVASAALTLAIAFLILSLIAAQKNCIEISLRLNANSYLIVEPCSRPRAAVGAVTSSLAKEALL